MSASPAADRLEWLVGVVREPDGASVEEFRAAYDPSDWTNWTVDEELARIRDDERLVRPFTVVSTDSDPAHATAVLVAADDKRWALTCWISEQPPYLVTGSRLVPAPPEGTVIREAVEAEAATLAALERRSPLRLGEAGDLLMTFDRGEDYFASARLMEDVTIYLAEVDGVIAGVYWGAQQPVRVNGEPKRLFLEHHVRIDPETRRGGVFWALCNYGRDTYARSADSIAFFVSPENYAVRKFVSSVPSWSVQPLRVLLPCPSRLSDDSGGRAGRVGEIDDAPLVAEVLNAGHADEELFVPYTAESLRARLERSPDQYGWHSLRVGEGAVVGVGGEAVTVTKERDGARHQTCRALVLDHGFVPGAEDAYRDLLLGWCAELGDEGITHLAAFTSAGCATHDVILELAEEVEPFDFWAFNIAEPPGLTANGFYVDPVYF